jgi:uncharacterized protein with NRDE domain
MCVIAVAWHAHPHWRLVLAGNRDEFYARPSSALARWPDADIIAGRDLEVGGTWLGMTAEGRCSVVTNVRNPRDAQTGLSRGLLVTEYLAGADDAPAHASRLRSNAADYRPFNLLTFDASHAFHVGNRPVPSCRALSDGVHGLSNAELDTPWPKTRHLCARLQQWIETADGSTHVDNFAPLFKALADESVAPDAELPDTGIGLERERWLSAAFIRGESYGTRASTVVAIDHDGLGVMVERRFGPSGRFDGETALSIDGHRHDDTTLK